jgi:5-formyltetrahydrofolate cyclo-ligase
VLSLPQYAAARTVLATMAIGSEWDTGGFLARAAADGKGIVLPRVTPPPRRLQLHAVGDIERDLVAGVWNIPEPDPARCAAVSIEDVDFALVPALAADREGFRLGYGAGYFDGLLGGRTAKTFCVTGAARPLSSSERLPNGAHDVAVTSCSTSAARVREAVGPWRAQERDRDEREAHRRQGDRRVVSRRARGARRPPHRFGHRARRSPW